jgi:putative tryptophan/tyrosine transport system substrate-binding protein
MCAEMPLRFLEKTRNVARQLAQLVSQFTLAVALILTAGPGVSAARSVTTSVPIVMDSQLDAVATGVAESLSHPGGNVTGFTFLLPELASKRLELIKQVKPSLTRVGLLLQGRSDSPVNRVVFDAANRMAAKLNTELVPITVEEAVEVGRALSDVPGPPVGGLVVSDAPYDVDSALIADAARSRGLPSIGAPKYPSAGGLLGYGVDFPAIYRRSAILVDKILKGAKPGDIPIEQATKFITIVNLKTAKALGIDIPPTVLASADEVIE